MAGKSRLVGKVKNKCLYCNNPAKRYCKYCGPCSKLRKSNKLDMTNRNGHCRYCGKRTKDPDRLCLVCKAKLPKPQPSYRGSPW